MQGIGSLTPEVLVIHPPLLENRPAFSSKSEILFRKWTSLLNVRHEYFNKDIHIKVKQLSPRMLITLGKTVTGHFTGESDLDRVQGYVIESFDHIPTIPCIEPKKMREQSQNVFWIKNAIDKATRYLEKEVRWNGQLMVDNNYATAFAFLSSLDTEASIDIETSSIGSDAVLTAFAVASKETSLSITPGGFSVEHWGKLLELFGKILADPSIEKVGQNLIFDFMMLHRFFGFIPAGPVFDTMHAANWINPTIPKKLEDLGRLYHFGTPWKGDWKATGEKLRIYNAKDALYTLYISRRQKSELPPEFFKRPDVFIPAFNMATTGIKLDIPMRDIMKQQLVEQLRPIEISVTDAAVSYVPSGQKKSQKRDNAKDIPLKGIFEINNLAKKEQKNFYRAKKADVTKHGKVLGHWYKKAYRDEISVYARAFNPKSPKQLLGTLKNMGVKVPVAKQQHTKEWAESTNDKALRKILERNNDKPDHLQFVRNMMILRRGYKLLTSYLNASLDADNRWRCSYNIEGTETGRSSSSKTPWKTGGNNQNIPRDTFLGVNFKDIFIADEGYVFFQSDQEQAEARVVAALSGDRTLLNLFAEGKDIHSFAMSSILGFDILSLKESDPEKFKYYRQCGKIVNHGGNYDMGPATLSESALKTGINMSVNDATKFLEGRRSVYPGVYEWHKEIQDTINRSRVLVTPFGRIRNFIEEITSNTYREAYAHIPQSVVPHITNIMWEHVARNYPKVVVSQMGHDALLMQIPSQDVDDFVKNFLTQTSQIKFACGTIKDFNIPWDASTGLRWGSLKKYRK